MNCNHKPQEPKWMISTEYGRYFFFDRVQTCKKCGARIRVANKKRCVALVVVMKIIEFMWLLLVFVAWNMGLKLLFLALYMGTLWISMSHIGNLVSWREDGMRE